MHEASAVEAIIAMVADEVAQRGGGKVTSLRLVAGEANGFMPASLEFYFGLLSKGTVLEGAGLECSFVKPLLHCEACGNDFERRRFSFDCPECGGPGTMTGLGRELFVESIDLEPPGAPC